jgi:hypothetical protein
MSMASGVVSGDGTFMDLVALNGVDEELPTRPPYDS